MTKRILVLGGGYAGTIAALRLSRARGVRITLVDARATFTQRIRNHEMLAGRSPATFAYRELLGRRGIEFVQGTAEAIDPAAGSVQLRTPAGAASAGYDHAILALGSRTRTAVPGSAANAVALDDPERLRVAAAEIARLPADARVLVVGGGMTGIEAAAELAERHAHLRVTLLAPRPLGSEFSGAGAAHLSAAFARLGIETRVGAVAAVEPGAAVLGSGEALRFDRCVWAAGFQAAPLARDSGLPVDASGRVRVDAALRVAGHPGLLAAGDAAAVSWASGTMRMGCVAALPGGAHAAASLRAMLEGREPEPLRFGILGRCVSLGRGNGLIQRTRADDTPIESILRNRLAVITKESICRMTIGVLRAEARLRLPLYAWPNSLTADATAVAGLHEAVAA